MLSEMSIKKTIIQTITAKIDTALTKVFVWL